MNKKGYDYAALMVIVVIISVSARYVQITKKTTPFERTIGDLQASALNVNSETTLYQMYVQEAAKLAVSDFAEQLRSDPTELFPEAINGCISLTTHTWIDWQQLLEQWVNKELLHGFRKESRHNPSPATSIDLARMSPQNKKPGGYLSFVKEFTPPDSFAIAIINGKIIGVALTPAEFSLTIKEQKIGKALYKPTFSIQDTFNIQELPTIVKTITTLAHDCDQDLATCARKSTGWEVVDEQGPITFRPPNQPCFSLQQTDHT